VKLPESLDIMSLNDPQWGRGGGSGDSGDGRRRRPDGQGGSPDLEELWRELTGAWRSVRRWRGGPGDGGSEL